MKNFLDPSVCSCFLDSYRYNFCYKIKWSTLSICAALLIIVIYLSSGLYALIDVTSVVTVKTQYDDDLLWPIASSSVITIMGWSAVVIHGIVVLLVILLICGILLEKPWIIFFWSVLMIFMLVADAVVTVLSLREYEQHNYRPSKQVRLLFFVMSIRLIAALCGIVVAIFHFRRLRQVLSDQRNRQRMLQRYHSESSSLSLHDSWVRSDGVENQTRFNTINRYVPDIPACTSLPRPVFGTIRNYPTSTVVHSQHKQLGYLTEIGPHSIGPRHNNDFRYNIPLQERFHQPTTRNSPKF